MKNAVDLQYAFETEGADGSMGCIHQVLHYLLDADIAMLEWNFDDWVGCNCSVAVLVPMRDDVFV